MHAVDVAELPAPLFRLFYQIEIRHFNSLNRYLLRAADTCDPTTRLWQWQGYYIEIGKLRQR